MKRPRWLLREATAASSEPQLQRAGSGGQTQDADGDNDGDRVDCPTCDDGMMADGTVCTTCGGAGTLQRAREAELTSKARKALPEGSFVFPSDRRYPIHDISHARNALARVAQKGTPAEEKTVKVAVYKRYPALKESRHERLVQEAERLRESAAGGLASTFGPISTTGEGYEVTLIKEGPGNSEDGRWYSREAIGELASSGLINGLKAFSDHPPLDEEELLPERSIKDLVGSYSGARVVESDGHAELRAKFTPVKGDGYEWVTTLAENALSNTTGEPLVGISFYGAAAGDDGRRPDGSYGAIAEVIRPTSADIVTYPGAGGEFVRRMVESARAKRAGKEGNQPMKLSELKTKMTESAKRLREADSDEKRTAALDELDLLAQAEVDAEAKPVDYNALDVGKLKESTKVWGQVRESFAPEIEAAKKASGNEDVAEKDAAIARLEGEKKDLEGKLSESERKNSATDHALLGMKVLREAKVPEGERERMLTQLREASTEDEMRDLVKQEQEHEARIVQRVRESAGLDFIEGNPGGTGEPGEGLLNGALAEEGIPMIDPAKAKEAAAAAA